MTGYQSKRAAAQAIDKVNWADHEPDGLAQPEQEPVAFLVDGDLYYPEEIDWETLQEQGHTVASLYTAPPQRKPLDKEQCFAIIESWKNGTPHKLIDMVEAAHDIKEKNT